MLVILLVDTRHVNKNITIHPFIHPSIQEGGKRRVEREGKGREGREKRGREGGKGRGGSYYVNRAGLGRQLSYAGTVARTSSCLPLVRDPGTVCQYTSATARSKSCTFQEETQNASFCLWLHVYKDHCFSGAR